MLENRKEILKTWLSGDLEKNNYIFSIRSPKPITLAPAVLRINKSLFKDVTVPFNDLVAAMLVLVTFMVCVPKQTKLSALSLGSFCEIYYFDWLLYNLHMQICKSQISNWI